MTSDFMLPDFNNIGASFTTTNFDIRNYIGQLTPNKEEKGKYICPACNGHNLSINLKTGKYQCWNCGDTQKIKEILTADSQDEPPKKHPRKKKTSYFNYPDRNGNPLIRVVRIDDGQGKKQIFQQHWDSQKWVTGYGPVKTEDIPLYRYQEVMNAIANGQQIVLAEGESTVDAFWSKGIPATTTIGGTGKTVIKVKDKETGQYNLERNDNAFETIKLALADLAEASVILAPDQDKPGCLHMEMMGEVVPIKGWLYALPNSFQWSRLPDNNGLDFVDWIHDYPKLTSEEILNHVKLEPIHKLEQKATTTLSSIDDSEKDYQCYLKELSIIAYEPDSDRQRFLRNRLAQKYRIPVSEIDSGILTVLGMAPPKVEEISVEDLLASDTPSGQFLVPGIPKVGVTLLAGQQGAGKTTIGYQLAKAVFSGESWFGEMPSTQGKTVFVSSDEPKSDAKDKADKTDLPPGSVQYLLNWKVKDWEKLADCVARHQPKLIIMDSFTGIHSEGFNENERSAATTILRLQQLAEQHQCAVLLLHHLGKDGKVRGSTTITSTPSAVLILEGRQEETRHLYSEKCRGEYISYRFNINNWDLSLDAVSGQTTTEELSNRQRILNALAQGVRLEIAEIVQLTGLVSKQVYNCLNKLKSAGQVACARSSVNLKRKVFFWISNIIHPNSSTPPQSLPELGKGEKAETTLQKDSSPILPSFSPEEQKKEGEIEGEAKGETLKPLSSINSASFSPQEKNKQKGGDSSVVSSENTDTDTTNSEPEIKVGDRVKILFCDKYGTVEAIDPQRIQAPYHIRLDNGCTTDEPKFNLERV